jgi:hypothetical protein
VLIAGMCDALLSSQGLVSRDGPLYGVTGTRADISTMASCVGRDFAT